jgi:hypothetical protein
MPTGVKSMGDLRVFATIESPMSLELIALQFQPPLTVKISEQILYIDHEPLHLTIMESAAGEFLLRGELNDLAFLQEHVITPLTRAAPTLHMDIFEEDGRLIKKIISNQ